MTATGDSKRIGSVRADFDAGFAASPRGGAVLIERTFRSLGVRRAINAHLGARSAEAQISTLAGVSAIMAGLTLGGRGMQACETLREDPLAATIFGLAQVPSPSTTYRMLCELAGLRERALADCYAPHGVRQPALDMLGRESRTPQRRRCVPEEPEAAQAKSLEALEGFGQAVAVACGKALPREMMRVAHWYACFGDATDLEVEGNCFDAARTGRDGEQALRWLTLMLGPIVVAQRLGAGNEDEGRTIPAVLARGKACVEKIVGRKARVLLLLDAAYFEQQVVDELPWDFIVCANQQRDSLRRLAEERPEWEWERTGPDASRGWEDSHVACFTHLPGEWKKPVTIVARRWREKGDLPGAWHYAFLATRLGPEDLPREWRSKYGYRQAIGMLYGTKQGRETHYKTPLRDFNLHHPPSGRLGVDQAFYVLATAASNIAMVMRYRVVDKEERGIAFWHFRERYLAIAGYVVRGGRTLTVWLSGANVDAKRQTLWRRAFAEAGQL
jgi:hypothetical protein